MKFFTHPLFVGLEFTKTHLKAASLKLDKKGLHIEEVKEIFLENPELVKPFYKELSSKQAFICSSIEGKDILMKSLAIPIMKENEILAAIEFQMEALLPYPIENALIQFHKQSESKTESSLAVFSVKKERLENHLKTLSMCQPEVVSCTPLSLNALYQHFFPRKEPAFLLHISEMFAHLILIEDKQLIAYRCFDRSNISIESESFKRELYKSLVSLETSFKSYNLDELILIGSEACEKKNVELIEEAAKKKVTVPFSSDEKFHAYSLCIGNALVHQYYKVNFRQKEYAYPHVWKREKKALALYFSLALFASASLFYIGEAKHEQHLTELRHQYMELASLENKRVDAEALSLSKLKEELQQFEKDISKRPEYYPLLPAIPKVSDLLAWISTHPQIAASLIEKDAPITVEGFNYTMVKRPDINHKKDHYQVKVDLEFTAQSPSVARALHDALLAPNPIVDPKCEVQWNSTKGRYKASFYVKDKTNYS